MRMRYCPLLGWFPQLCLHKVDYAKDRSWHSLLWGEFRGFWIIFWIIILIMFSMWIFLSLFLIMRHITRFITRHTETWKWIRTLCNILCCQLKPLMRHLLSEFMFNSLQKKNSFTGSKIHQHADDRIMIVAWALQRLGAVEYITAW